MSHPGYPRRAQAQPVRGLISALLRGGLLVMLAASCRQSGSTSDAASLDEASPTPTSVAQPTAGATPILAPAATPTPSPITPLPQPSAAPASGPSATPLPLVDEPCGVRLPLLPEPGPTPVQQLDAAQSLDDIPPEARAAVRYLLNQPDDVAVVAYRLGQEADGVFHNPDAPMPLASVTKIINLIAYARAVESGALDPAEWVPLEELERFYLPNSDLSSHRYALEDAAARDMIANEATPLEEIAWMMIRHSSNAASDYLAARLGQVTIEESALALGLATQTAPCSFLGQFLAMANHTRAGSDATALADYVADLGLYGADASRLASAYTTDEGFRLDEIAWRRSQRRPNMPTQQQYSATLGAQATAGEYARLMATIAANELGSGYLNILVRRYLEWPMVFEANQERFWTMGFKGGSLPGILTGVYYAEPLTYRTPVVVAIFYRDLPTSTYRRWRREWPHDELALWLLSDANAIPTLKNLLN